MALSVLGLGLRSLTGEPFDRFSRGMSVAADKQVIIVGGGHNGLVAAAYLARAGLDVQVLERRELVGGAAVTEEWFPGYRLSTCSYICHLLQQKVIEELELRKHGFHVYSLEPMRFMPFPNGNFVRLWHDDDKSAEEIDRVSPHDAESFPRWMSFWKSASRILNEHFLCPPPTLTELFDKARDMGEQDVLETLLTVPLKDLLEQYFESEEMRAFVCSQVDGGDITAPGSAYASAYFHLADFRDDQENHGLVRGGMGTITIAMARAAEAHGASIRTDAEVARILTERGRVTGVELADGEVLEADVVVSNADPKRTFLTLVDEEDLNKEFLRGIRGLNTNSASLKFHCALNELPDFSAYLGPDFDPKHLASIKICPSLDYYQASWEDARGGRASRYPVMQVQIPTVYDPTLAPEGHHVMSMWVYYQPAKIKGGTWSDEKEAVGERLIDELSQYAPNIRRAIVDWAVFTPEDIEERVGLTDGNIRHIDMIPQQVLRRRPLPGWADYRTPIDGLYMCGAGTHPGGEVTGAPGHNAAHMILEEMGASI